MRRRWVSILAMALLITLIGGDLVEAKKSRSSRRSSRAVVKKGSRAKARRGRTAKIGRAKYARRRMNTFIVRRGRTARSRRKRNVTQAIADLPRPASSNIPAERITEIQEALIKVGYLEGPATGLYDDKTTEAMKQFQADNKLHKSGLPSAHALKKLGVSKRSNDGYAVPVSNISENEKKPPPQLQ